MARRRRSEVLTQAILASAPDAVVVVDDDGAVVEFNPAAERMFGVRRTTVIGSALSDGMLLASSPADSAPLDGSYEATATRSDGATFPAEVSTAPVVGVDARLRVLYVRDISERRRAQRAVYDLAAIIESSDDAIISKTLDGVIESWNAGAERLYGHTAAEAIGQRISLVEPLGRPTSRPRCWR
jgi:PAS domain S-box-containing protein